MTWAMTRGVLRAALSAMTTAAMTSAAMTSTRPRRSSAFATVALCRIAAIGLFMAVTWLAVAVPARAQSSPPHLPRPSDAAVAKLAQSIVRLQAFVPPEARSARRLGTKREGSGVVVDRNGLIVTIGYLISEAMAVEVTDSTGASHRADVVAYDHASGLGLVRLSDKAVLPPLEIGNSKTLAERQLVIVAPAGGADAVQPALVVSRREFAGSWEYLLDRAIYTSPPSAQFGGAALIGGDGKLLGIGSLILEAVLPGQPVPGNVFVPIDLLAPILEDIAATGKLRPSNRPWLGMNVEETHGGMLIVNNVTRDGPARKAGIERGDVVLSVGNQRIHGLIDFYRRVWSLGGPGVAVPLEVMQKDGFNRVTIKSDDRNRFYKLQPTY
ncbi:MAG TPA: S1C family serine protease [Lacipirellula sp.]